MNAYVLIENLLVAALALASVWFALRALMPGTVRRARTALALRLDRAEHSRWARALARRVATQDEPAGCATGCGSACKSCAIGAAQKSGTFARQLQGQRPT
jgi:hypothetical protein